MGWLISDWVRMSNCITLLGMVAIREAQSIIISTNQDIKICSWFQERMAPLGTWEWREDMGIKLNWIAILLTQLRRSIFT